MFCQHVLVQRETLLSQPSSIECEELAGQMPHLFRIGRPFAADVVVHGASVGGFMDVGERQIHAVALDGFRDAADKYHRAVRFDPFHHADVGQRIVQLAVAVEVPSIVEEDQIAGLHRRALVDSSVLP